MNKYLPKINIKKSGSQGPSLAVICCMHGDEALGNKVINNIFKLKIKKGTLLTVLANPQAYVKKKRFINEDLNRVFPGGAKTYEQKLAKNILKIVKDVDCLVDIHTTTGKTEPFAIIIKNNPKTIKLIKKTGLKNVVVMGKNLASGNSLIDQIDNSFSIEYYSKTATRSFQLGLVHTKSVMAELGLTEHRKKTTKRLVYYQVTGVLEKQTNFKVVTKLNNFKLIKKGTLLGYSKGKKLVAVRDFYPVFYQEKAYPNLICLQAEKISSPNI